MLERLAIFKRHVGASGREKTMRKSKRLVLLLTGLALTLLACSRPATSSQSIVHEQQWIVRSIGQDIAEIMLLAANKNRKQPIALETLDCQTEELSPDCKKYAYKLTWSNSNASQNKEFELVNYVWDPGNYASWAAQLMNFAKVQPAVPASSGDDSFLERLSNFTPQILQEENKRLSEALTARPLDAGLHEQAALLCVTWALRESASCFEDVRPWLNRMSAHLAIARSLRNTEEYSIPGKLAEAALMCLSGHTAEGNLRIDSLKSAASGESMKSWLRALKIFTTKDYRTADLEKASLMERLQYGRAIADDIGSDYLTDYLRKSRSLGSGTIDWLRIGARGIHTVESGHLYAEPGVAAEVADFNRDFSIYKTGSIKSRDEAVTELSRAPTRCLVLSPTPQLQVVSWPDLAAYHARHLLDSIFQKYYFEKSMWGVPDQARETINQSAEVFSRVRLYPLCELSYRWVDGEKTDASLSARLSDLVSKSPEDVNSNLWHRIGFCSAAPQKVPDLLKWFVPRFPFGTVYDFAYRHFDGDPELSAAELKELAKVSPYNQPLLYSWISMTYPHDSFTGEQLAAAYGALADVDIVAMNTVADAYKKAPEKYAQQMEKIARLQPDKYFDLGSLYVDESKPEKAKEAYENGVRLCRDNVMLSNNCSWLVNYYYDHEQTDKALELATRAAKVYSARGLQTMAELYERMGKLKEAEDSFLNIKERYDNTQGLCQFYLRHKSADPRYQQEYDKLIKSLFPDGLVKVEAAHLSGAPKTGVKVTSESPLTDKFCVHYGDIFVGVDGYRVESVAQYHFVRGLDSGKNMEFTVWNGKEYRTVKAILPDRRWECGISDFKKD
jgi:tetratricopeptide (TPR) repeat protein